MQRLAFAIAALVLAVGIGSARAADEVVIGALAKLAALRGIVCIAEWVEDAAIMPRLAALGVDYAQGYAIHRPEPLENLVPKGG